MCPVISDLVLHFLTLLLGHSTKFNWTGKSVRKLISKLKLRRWLAEVQRKRLTCITRHSQTETFLETAELTSITIHPIYNTVFLSRTLVVHHVRLTSTKEALLIRKNERKKLSLRSNRFGLVCIGIAGESHKSLTIKKQLAECTSFATSIVSNLMAHKL